MPKVNDRKAAKPGEFHIRIDDGLGRRIRNIADQEGRDYSVQIERLLSVALGAEKGKAA